MPFWLTRGGPPARQYSSSKISQSMSDAPPPAYSSGHATTDQRASAIRRSHSRCAAKPSAVSREGRFRGTFADNHSRTSARNASCAAVKARSTAATLSDAASGRFRHDMATQVPAVEGWFTLDDAAPALLGGKCTQCGTYVFPNNRKFCPNPLCTSEQFNSVELSRRGR